MSQHDPAGRNHAPSATPPKDGAAVRWKRDIDIDRGFGYAPTPIVADGRVYAAGRELLVLDAEMGTVEFRVARRSQTPPAVASARAYRSPTLAVTTSRSVTGLHANGGLKIFGSHLGVTRWEGGERDQQTTFFGAEPQTSPPVAVGETILVAAMDELRAIDASSGKVRWRKDVDTRRPAVRRGTVYVAEYPGGVRGYDLETGESRFDAEVDVAPPLSVTAGPDQLVVATDDGLAGLSYEGETRWEFAPGEFSRDYGAVALAEGVAYAGFRGEDDTYLVAVDAADGSERWRSEVAPEQTPQFAPPSVADGAVYVPTEDGGMAAVDAADGHLRWRFGEDVDTHGPWSPAALVGETLYAIGDGHVYALEES
jgi:outer membrane protein assembly factor BamB